MYDLKDVDPEEYKTKAVCISMPKVLIKMLNEVSVKEGRSFSNTITHHLFEKIKK